MFARPGEGGGGGGISGEVEPHRHNNSRDHPLQTHQRNTIDKKLVILLVRSYSGIGFLQALFRRAGCLLRLTNISCSSAASLHFT